MSCHVGPMVNIVEVLDRASVMLPIDLFGQLVLIERWLYDCATSVHSPRRFAAVF